MENISATIITLNEEENIERCLNSLVGLVDEIIVVDSGSTDKTVEICKRYGCHVVTRPFAGYGQQRQYATSLTRHRYVLAIDADEALDEELHNQIKKLKDDGFDHRAYRVNRILCLKERPVNYSRRDGEPIRLFNKRYAQWNFDDKVERVNFAEALQPAPLRGHLLHYRDYVLSRSRGNDLAQDYEIHITLAPGYEHLRGFVKSLIQRGVPKEAHLVYRSRRNGNFQTDACGEHLNIKAFKIPSFPNDRIYGTLRKCKAERSYLNAQALEAAGFHTPHPIAYCYRRRGGRMLESYYICSHLDNTFDMRLWADNPQASAAMPGMARLLADLHRAGIWHKDFSPGNILVRKGADGTLEYNLIDLNRMETGVHDKSKQLTNLGTVYIENEEETGRFGELYAQALGKSAEWGRRQALHQLHAYQRRKKLKKGIKHFIRCMGL